MDFSEGQSNAYPCPTSTWLMSVAIALKMPTPTPKERKSSQYAGVLASLARPCEKVSYSCSSADVDGAEGGLAYSGWKCGKKRGRGGTSTIPHTCRHIMTCSLGACAHNKKRVFFQVFAVADNCSPSTLISLMDRRPDKRLNDERGAGTQSKM